MPSSDAIVATGTSKGLFTMESPMVCGAEADDIFSFRANAAGQFTVTAQLRPLWDDNGAIYETRTFNVYVAPAAQSA